MHKGWDGTDVVREKQSLVIIDFDPYLDPVRRDLISCHADTDLYTESVTWTDLRQTFLG